MCCSGEQRGGEERDAAPAKRRRLRILIVDDDEGVLRCLARLLSVHEVFKAADYVAAEQALLDPGVSLDVVVSDYRMPGRSGADVLLAASRIQPVAVRVLLTSDPPADIEELIAAGVVHNCVLKPFTPSLAGRLEEIARSHRPAGPSTE